MRLVSSVGVALLGLAVLVGARGVAGGGPAKQTALPREEFAKLVADDAQAVRAGLARGARDKSTARRVKAAAFMIAVYAEATRGQADDRGLAALRDAALQVVELVNAGKGKEAAKLVGLLNPDAKAPGGKPGPVAWEKQLPFEDVMRQFSAARLGGFGLEKELEELGEKDALTAAHLERLARLGYKMALIGRVAEAYADAKSEGGNRTKQNWLTFSEQFRKASLDLARAARAKNQAGARSALERVNKTCTKCHDVFR